MELRFIDSDGVQVVSFQGSWDGQIKCLMETREEFQSPQRDMVFDFSGVSYLDSAGLGVLVQFAKSMKSLGLELRLCCVRPVVQRVMKLVHVDRILPLDGTLEESVSRIQAGVRQ